MMGLNESPRSWLIAKARLADLDVALCGPKSANEQVIRGSRCGPKRSGWGWIDLLPDVNVSSPTLLLHAEENGFDFAQLSDLLPYLWSAI